MTRTLAIDGSYLARAKFSSEPSSCIQSFIAALVELREKLSPEITMIAWDSYDEPFRRQIYTEYKVKRRERNAQWELRDQYHATLGELKSTLQVYNVIQLEARGYEADDVLATISRTWPGGKILYTPDHDLLQLVNGETFIMQPRTPDELITPNNIVEKTCLTAKGHLDLATLAGCAGDGVPGLTGVAELRAARLLSACPQIVDLLLSDDPADHEEARRRVVAVDAKMSRWAELAIKERDLVVLTRKLVSLYTVELETI